MQLNILVLDKISLMMGKTLFINSDFRIVYNNGVILKCEEGRSFKLSMLPLSGKHKFLGRFRLINRMLRLEPRTSEMIDNKHLATVLSGKIYIVELEDGTTNIIETGSEGFGTPLNLCKVEDCLFYGDYGSNPYRKSVNIYMADMGLRSEKIYSFPENSIRHIHNIRFDKANNRFWVSAGDNESKAGIYQTNLKWTEVVPFKIGKQKYRTVTGFPYGGGYLYATDSVEKENHLYYIDKNGKEKILTSINGSCIYGTEIKDYFIFSTTVESPEGGGYLKLLSTRLGGGIKNREVHLIAVRKSNLAVRVIRKYKKDIWPMKLFQYGTLMFPAGQEQSEDLWCYGVACKGIDGKNIHITKDEIDGKFIQNT